MPRRARGRPTGWELAYTTVKFSKHGEAFHLPACRYAPRDGLAAPFTKMVEELRIPCLVCIVYPLGRTALATYLAILRRRLNSDRWASDRRRLDWLTRAGAGAFAWPDLR